MSVRLPATVVVASIFLLTGCAMSSPSPAQTPSASGSTAQSMPTPSSTPTPAAKLIVTLDTLAYTGPDGLHEISLTEVDEVVGFVEELTGVTPELQDVADPWGNGESVGTSYIWPEIRVSHIFESVGIAVLAPTIAGVPVSTSEGITVGSSREAVLAVEGWEEWDEDGDGLSDYMGIGGREVPGTQSLSRPGETGTEYILVGLAGEVVDQIQIPANDFSDI